MKNNEQALKTNNVPRFIPPKETYSINVSAIDIEREVENQLD